jgi:hypothetical protein
MSTLVPKKRVTHAVFDIIETASSTEAFWQVTAAGVQVVRPGRPAASPVP